MQIKNTAFDPISAWDIALQNTNPLSDVTCTNLFDQNGYHLTAIEQCYAEQNGYMRNTRRHETVIRKPWLVWDKIFWSAYKSLRFYSNVIIFW